MEKITKVQKPLSLIETVTYKCSKCKIPVGGQCRLYIDFHLV